MKYHWTKPTTLSCLQYLFTCLISIQLYSYCYFLWPDKRVHSSHKMTFCWFLRFKNCGSLLDFSPQVHALLSYPSKTVTWLSITDKKFNTVTVSSSSSEKTREGRSSMLQLGLPSSHFQCTPIFFNLPPKCPQETGVSPFTGESHLQSLGERVCH